MEDLFARYDFELDTLTIQPQRYMDGGWSILNYKIGGKYVWEVRESPQYGGEEYLVDKFSSFRDALARAKKLM